MSKSLFRPKTEDSINWRRQDYRFACCDCGLVHWVRFEVDGSRLRFVVRRDNRATGQIRRRRLDLPARVKR